MQSVEHSSPSWVQIAYVLAGFLGGGAGYKLLTTLLNWRKPKAELIAVQTRTEKTRAEIRRINVQADSAIGNAVVRITARLIEMQEFMDDVVEERDRLKRANDQKQTELDLAEVQIKKMKALLDIHQIKYSEFDER